MEKKARIYVAGHTGLVGSAVVRRLKAEGYTNVLTAPHASLDLTRQADVDAFFDDRRPEYVFLCAARVGGILANSTYPAWFIYDNIMIAANVIHASFRTGVKKLLNLGSSCIYPKFAPQPLREDALLTGPLEPTNEAYAVAKIAAIKLCRYYNAQYKTDYLSVMPTNLYGPFDNFDLESSHVLPALIRRFHEARIRGDGSVVLWGTGTPRREFLHVDDLARACVFLMQNYSAEDIGEFVNIGTGTDVTIAELAGIVAGVVGYWGRIEWDTSKPDGTPRKLLDVSRIRSLGWEPAIGLSQGIADTYRWFLDNFERIRGT
ncbi:MAG TPA: GDP-L-fucose synthase [Deltaproteobacteria bacterium]|nr:GDP-L-fucose synthase [Deltaproteobacteria bacterium]HOM29463.1 GDP-L-fucose synthase [Deltaproteobacteria bacterium]